jgi:hypothetical protein
MLRASGNIEKVMSSHFKNYNNLIYVITKHNLIIAYNTFKNLLIYPLITSLQKG